MIFLIASLVVPLAAIVVIFATGRWPNVRDGLHIAAAGLTFALTSMLAPTVFAGEAITLNLYQWLPGIEIKLTPEPLGMIFALVASGLWILTTIYAIGYMRGHHEENQTRFFACFPAAIFAALAAAHAGNLVTLFAAYEFMTLATYPLVTHHGDDAARRGGRIYLGVLISSSIAMFLFAVAWTGSIAGTTDFRLGGILDDAYDSGRLTTIELGVLLALFVFGIGKAALMPMHRWLPAAMVAPTPVSALLHAVAVVKVGVFSVLKISTYIFGIDLLARTGVSVPLMYLAGFTILCSSIIAMQQDNLKRRLAYSTVSQLAYITLGAMVATSTGAIGGGMHIVMHAVAKITLFFCAGAIMVAHHKTDISTMRGLGRKMPWTFLAFGIATVSIIGIPPGGGAWSKWFLAVATVESHHYLLTAVLMISSLLNIAYLMPIPILAFMSPPDQPDEGVTQVAEAPMMCVVPLLITAVGSVILFFTAGPIYQVLSTLYGVSP